jgi:hypothetical protein
MGAPRQKKAESYISDPRPSIARASAVRQYTSYLYKTLRTGPAATGFEQHFLNFMLLFA